MIDLYKQREKYKIAVVQENLTSWVEDAVTSMSWGGNKSEAARTLNLEVLKVDTKTDFSEGSVVVIYNAFTNKETMRYIITKKSKTRSSTAIKYTARDIRWWLTRSKMDKNYINKTASEIVIDLCKVLGIKPGEIEDTKERFLSLYFEKKSPWDIIITALTETRKRNGKKYTTRVKDGKLELVEKLKQASKWVIEEGVNLLEATYEESIESMYTKVVVSGKDAGGNEITAIEKNEKAQKAYGIMQEQISQSDKSNQLEINKIAVQKLKELSTLQKSGTVKTFGIDGVEAGGAVYVVDRETGLVGGFYVESDSHTYKDGYHEMSLTLAWTDELPAIDYQAPNQKVTTVKIEGPKPIEKKGD